MITKNILKIALFFLAGMVGGIFAEQILWPYLIERPLLYQYKIEQNPIYLTERKQTIIQENTALTEAIGKVADTIIGVKTQTKDGQVLMGSGLIVTADGLIVTLADLVPQGSSFSFFVEGKATSFQILKRDLKANLALIKVEKTDLPSITFADVAKTVLGERVFLVAAVFNETTTTAIVDEGIISSFKADLTQTNISGNKSLAGSILFNIQAEALGINTIDDNGKVRAIPVDIIKTFIGM